MRVENTENVGSSWPIDLRMFILANNNLENDTMDLVQLTKISMSMYLWVKL